MENFIVVEGICCSGKSTFCANLQESLNHISIDSFYNHGAFTYTDSGKAFRQDAEEKDFTIATSYYLSDLIISTQNTIKPKINSHITVIQDRYSDSIATFISAYGQYVNKNCNIDRVILELQKNELLLTPMITIYCLPSFDTITERMINSKNSLIHNYYRNHPDFLKIVYEEIIKKIKNSENSFIVETDSRTNTNEMIANTIEIIKRNV